MDIISASQLQLTKSSTSFESSESGLPSDEPIMCDPSPWCCRMGSVKRHSLWELVFTVPLYQNTCLGDRKCSLEFWPIFSSVAQTGQFYFYFQGKLWLIWTQPSVTHIWIHEVLLRQVSCWPSDGSARRSFRWKGVFVRCSSGRIYLSHFQVRDDSWHWEAWHKLTSPSRWVLCKHTSK